MTTDADYMRMQIASAPTPHDLHAYATSSRTRRTFDTMVEADKADIRQRYSDRMNEIAGRYKINYLNGVPLTVEKVEKITNDENGTVYLEIEGSRKDLGEPVKVRTRADGIMRFFNDHPELPSDVVFHRIMDRSQSHLRSSPIWVVRHLASLSLINSNPFDTVETDGNGG